METGVIKLYHNFREYLGSDKNRKKIAVLLLTAKIEGYLVKEFLYNMYRYTKGKVFALTNLGNRGEQKIDICLLRGDIHHQTIYGMIEAKFFRNIPRYWVEFNAKDEITPALKDLKKQTGRFKKAKHAGIDVNLTSPNNEIYGLVFCSYVGVKEKENEKEEFYERILNKKPRGNSVVANDWFKYHDLPKAYLDEVFDDVEVSIFKKPGTTKPEKKNDAGEENTFYVSLRTGLWRRKNSSA